jgi:hypothetical protein
MKADKAILCHHCGKRIVWNRHDEGGGHWAHAILVFGGTVHSLGNAMMVQGCNEGGVRRWATPVRQIGGAK